MGIIYTKNIHEESHELFFITGLIGLRPPRFWKRSFPGYIYSALVLVCFYLLAFFTIDIYEEVYADMRVYCRSLKTREVQRFFNFFLVPFFMVVCVYKNFAIRALFDEIRSIDGKLKLLNVHIDHASFRKADIVRLCEVLLFTLLFNLLEYFPQVGPITPSLFVFTWIAGAFPQFMNSVIIASFVITIGKIRRRFEAINNFIRTMTIFEKNGITNLESDTNNVFRLRLLNKIHEKLIDVTISLSEAFGLVILLSFIIYFVVCCSLLDNINAASQKIEDFCDLIIETLWFIFYLCKYLYVIQACHSIAVQGKLSGRLVSDKSTDVDHHPLKQETEVLAQRIKSRDLQLRACNFFVIDYPALKPIIVGFAAYFFIVSHFTFVYELTNNPAD